MGKLRDDLPLGEKLRLAFLDSFEDKIGKTERKKGEILAEVRTQKVNKQVGNPTNNADKVEKSNRYTSEQLAAARKMGVTLPK